MLTIYEATARQRENRYLFIRHFGPGLFIVLQCCWRAESNIEDRCCQVPCFDAVQCSMLANRVLLRKITPTSLSRHSLFAIISNKSNGKNNKAKGEFMQNGFIRRRYIHECSRERKMIVKTPTFPFREVDDDAGPGTDYSTARAAAFMYSRCALSSRFGVGGGPTCRVTGILQY